MPDTKITALTAIGANPINVATFPIPMVDLTDTSMAASGTTKKVTVNQILGAGGTATLASATITGDLTVDTSTLKVDSANDRVGVGTASPAAGAKLGVLGATSVSASDYVGSSTWAARFIGSSNGAASGISFLTNSSGGFPTPASIHATPISDYRSALIATYAADSVGAGYFAVNRFNNAAGATVEHYKIDNAGIATWSNVGGVAGTAMTLNANGLGIGVTPSAWASGIKGLQIGSLGGSSIIGYSNACEIGSNFYFDTGYKYGATAASSQIQFTNGEIRFKNAASGTAGTAITFTQAMTLDASGNLLVGTTSQNGSWNTKLTLSNDSGTTKWAVGPYLGGVTNFLISAGASAGVYLNGTAATSWTSASDERLKDIIEPISNAVSKVASLRAVIGKFKFDENNTRKPFLIAQDVQAVLPEAVDASNPDKLGVAYSEVIPLLVAAIKELTARVQTLETR